LCENFAVADTLMRAIEKAVIFSHAPQVDAAMRPTQGL
jgi:hypothetical protein